MVNTRDLQATIAMVKNIDIYQDLDMVIPMILMHLKIKKRT